MKLFREWSAKWPADVTQMLRDKCLLVDGEWSARFAAQLAGDLTLENGYGAATSNGIDASEVVVVNGAASHQHDHVDVHNNNGVDEGVHDDEVDVEGDGGIVGVIDAENVGVDGDEELMAAQQQQQQQQLSQAMNLQNGPSVVSA